MAIKLATFDLDGTLVHRKSKDISTLKIDAINHAISARFNLENFNYFDHFGKEVYGMTDRTILRKVLINNNIQPKIADDSLPGLFTTICDYFDSHSDRKSSDDYNLLDGIESLLNRLVDERFKLGMATGNIKRFAYWKTDSFGLTDRFTFGGFGDDCDERADIVACALRRGGFENGSIACHFGDSINDVRAARQNKILSVAITEKGGGTFSREELSSAGADLVVDSWLEIDKIMKLVNNGRER